MKIVSMISSRWLLLTALFAVVAIARGAHAAEPYDIDVYKIDVKNSAAGNKTFQEGEMVAISCNYSVMRMEMASWPPQSWNMYVGVDRQQVWQKVATIEPPPGPKISKAFGWTWTAKGVGSHTVRCGFSSPKLSDVKSENNEARLTISVIAKKGPTQLGPLQPVAPGSSPVPPPPQQGQPTPPAPGPRPLGPAGK